MRRERDRLGRLVRTLQILVEREISDVGSSVVFFPSENNDHLSVRRSNSYNIVYIHELIFNLNFDFRISLFVI